MAGAIQTPAATPEYRDHFADAMRRTQESETSVKTKGCQRCGKVLKITSECACSAMRVGGAAAGRSCERCGRQTSSASARLCDYCEFHRGGRRR